MNYPVFHFIHLCAVFMLVSVSFYAIAWKQDRKKMLMYSGICSLVAILTGFGLLGFTRAGFPGWAMVKIAVWLVLSAMAGLAFRIEARKPLVLASMLLVFLAVGMVAFKPF